MKRGQTTLEYIYLAGVVAAAIIAMLAYVGRGFQGNIRNQANQISSEQYEPGSTTTVNNSVTKHVSSAAQSTSITSVQYGGKGAAGAALQARIDQNLRDQRIKRSKLAVLSDEWNKATLKEALAKSQDWYPIKIIKNIVGWVADKVRELFGGKSGPPPPSNDAWATIQDQTTANDLELDTLYAQLRIAEAKARQDPGYQEQVDVINEQIQEKLRAKTELDATFDLMVLQTDKADVPAQYLDQYLKRKTELVPDWETNPDAVKAKLAEITAAQAARTKAQQDDLAARGAVPDSGSFQDDGQGEMSLGSLFNAIMGIKPPPTYTITGNIRPLAQVNRDLAQNKADLARLVNDYTYLLQALDALEIRPDVTLSSQNINTETSNTTVNTIKDETLGNL
jgi:hypothetical protein